MKQNKINSGASEQAEVKSENHADLPFGKSNYTIMIAGVALIVLGYFIMTLDKEEFGFGFLGITLGPLVAFAGFMVEFYAILKKKS